MTTFTFPDLVRILKESAGADESVTPIDESQLDAPFESLGYDSLAMLELAARVQREFVVPIPDDSLEHMTTPRATVAYVNERLAEAVRAS